MTVFFFEPETRDGVTSLLKAFLGITPEVGNHLQGLVFSMIDMEDRPEIIGKALKHAVKDKLIPVQYGVVPETYQFFSWLLDVVYWDQIATHYIDQVSEYDQTQ